MSPRRYARRHPEIFNPVEQERLAAGVRAALAEVRSPAREALDFGCGTGNVTRHLLAAGAQVVAADVSERNLAHVARRFGVETLHLDGGPLPRERFDLVAAYSVLHHIPDYLAALDDLAAALRPGGVLYLDHEAHEAAWQPDGCVAAYRAALAEHWRWRRLAAPRKIARRVWREVHPRSFFGAEGDLHVWPWDHIEWDRVVERLEALGLEVVRRDDHLGYTAGEPRAVWERFRDRCADMTALTARRR